jgi:hypothetical protein
MLPRCPVRELGTFEQLLYEDTEGYRGTSTSRVPNSEVRRARPQTILEIMLKIVDLQALRS